MSEGDVRRKIGGRVTAKACHVVFLGECARRYGALKTTKVIVGTVVEVTTTRKPQTNRTSTFVTADFDLGGGAVKRSTLNIRSVKAFVPDLTTSPNDADTAAVAAPNNMLDNIDALPTVTADTATETDLFHMEAGVDQHPILEQDTESLVQLPVLPIVPNADFGNNNFSEAEAVPATVAHGTKWYEDDEATLNDTNGSVPLMVYTRPVCL
jgi:hypothetical protein